MPPFWPFGWDRVILEDYRGSPRPLPRPSSAHAVDALRETDRSGTREGGDGSVAFYSIPTASARAVPYLHPHMCSSSVNSVLAIGTRFTCHSLSVKEELFNHIHNKKTKSVLYNSQTVNCNLNDSECP